MNRMSHFSSLLLVVALSPVFLETAFSCERGDANLADLQYDTGGQNQIYGFASADYDYNVYDGSLAAVVTTVASDSGSTILYQWIVNGAAGDATGGGTGGGTTELTVPAGRSTLRVTVRSPEGAVKTYLVEVNPACASTADCADGNGCNDGLCDFVTSDCSFTNTLNFSTCNFIATDDGLCQEGVCEGGFCGTDPIDCTGSNDCATDGACVVSCDPTDSCDRCPGQDEKLASGTPCATGFQTTTGNVCAPNGTCVECIDSQNRGHCVNGANAGQVCDPNASPSECPNGACLTNPANVFDNPNCDSTANECLLEPSFCDLRACQPRPQAPNGTACTGGECIDGVCEFVGP